MAYLPLSTANLPDPVIDPAQGESPADYFSADIWSGNSASSSGDSTVGQVISSGFQPDWIWTKERNNTGGHKLFDTVRGLTKQLSSNSTAAEETRNGDDIVAVSASGYTLGTNTGINYNGRTYVGWSWKANGSGVSNTDGSITSTVSANTESGFSICTYTGNNTNGATFGHGLNSAPEMVIFKRRDSTSSWAVGHTDLGWDGIVILNSTNAFNTGYNIFNSVAPSSSVVTLGNTGDANEGTIVAYCFHSVDGFSRIGSYTGNGSSSDGTFVYTGFRPAFLLLKVTSTADDWIIWDGVRSPENLADNALKPNSSDAEVTGNINNSIDLVSNGFKCRNNNEKTNFNGYNYIYMAFAENPFKYSNAR